jgi:anti-sigma factor RsiW
MEPTFLDHPTEETLERFVLNRSGDEELEIVETHILACDSCVARLEYLENEIADIKTAAAEVRLDAVQREYSAPKVSWRSWFTVPKLSWAGAVAALALGIALTPQFIHRAGPVAEVSLTAYRGLENPIVPAREPLHLHLNAADLPEGAVAVQIVNQQGSSVWKGSSEIRHDQVNITVPSMTKSGTHFLRLYQISKDNPQGELLREFAFQVK